jgi:TonB family protein
MMILLYVAILVYSAIATPVIPAQSGQVASAEFQNSASATQVQTYPDTADGLHDLIQRLAAAIQKGDSDEITTLTHSLIIPNFQEWLPQVFGPEIGTHMVMPKYPDEAKAQKIQGTEVLHTVIDFDGSILELQWVSGPPELKDAAVDAVKQWRYEPTLLNGEPVQVDTTISVVFTLGKK